MPLSRTAQYLPPTGNPELHNSSPDMAPRQAVARKPEADDASDTEQATRKKALKLLNKVKKLVDHQKDLDLSVLSPQSLEIKKAIIDIVMKQEFIVIEDDFYDEFDTIVLLFEYMKMGLSEEESELRRNTIRYYLKKEMSGRVAVDIKRFMPFSQDDLPLLLEIAKPSLKEKVQSRLTGRYLDSLREGVESQPKEYNLHDKVFQFDVNDEMVFLKTIFIENNWPVCSNIKNADSFVSDQMGGFLKTNSPPIMQKLKKKILSSSENIPAEIKNCFEGFSACLSLFFLGKKFDENQEICIIEIFDYVCKYKNENFYYAAVNIIGKSIQDPQAANKFFSSIDQFTDKVWGVLIFWATAGHDELFAQCSLILRKSESYMASNTKLCQSSALALLSFAFNASIDSNVKQQVLGILLKSIERPEQFFSEISGLGALDKVLCHAACNRAEKIVIENVLSCGTFSQIHELIQPNSAFFKKVCEDAILLSNSSANHSFFIKKLKYSGSLTISEESRLNWLKEFITSRLLNQSSEKLLTAINTFVDIFFEKKFVLSVVDSLNMAEAYNKARADEDWSLIEWIESAAFIILTMNDSYRNSTFVKETINQIAKFYDAPSREMAISLLCKIAYDSKSDATFFENFSKKISRKHAKIFLPALFLLSGKDKYSEKISNLLNLVRQQHFKDTKKAVPMLKFISQVVLVEQLTVEQKCHLVGVLTESIDLKKKISLTLPMQYALSLTMFANSETALKEQTLTALSNIRSIQDVENAMRKLINTLFSVPDAEEGKFFDDYENYVQNSRAPTALVSFASAHCTTPQTDLERSKILAEIALLARCLVTPGYEVNEPDSHHNAILQQRAPLAWQIWREDMSCDAPISASRGGPNSLQHINVPNYLKEKIVSDRHVERGTYPLLEQVLIGKLDFKDAFCEVSDHNSVEGLLLSMTNPAIQANDQLNVLGELLEKNSQLSEQFLRDLKDLKKFLKAPDTSSKKHRNFQVSISSKAEDLFLIGTDVIGSCQHIDGLTELNKALPAYVLDKKYMAALVTDKNGSIMSRRILRLVWSQNLNQPAIYVEREYSNPGVPQEVKDISIDLIHQKAEKMGVFVVGDDENLPGDRSVGALSVYESQRPWEYVDALSGIQNYGNYVIQKAKIIDRVDNSYESLLRQVLDHVDKLKELRENNLSPRDFIRETRDLDKSEFLLPKIIQCENDRNPGLNLALCSHQEKFAHEIAEFAKAGKPGQTARFLTTVQTDGMWHVVAHEANIVDTHKIYIRGFDALPDERAKKYFDAIQDDLRIQIAEMDAKIQIKVDTFALSEQESPTGCDFFSLSFALKSFAEQFDHSGISFKHDEAFDSNLISDLHADQLPLMYYKHAQPVDFVDKFYQGTRPFAELHKPVNSKGETISDRFKRYTIEQTVYSLRTGQYKDKKFSDSIDAKRIVFYERLADWLQEKISAGDV
ncbi:MAG: YopJ family acetyltransferase [Burkholderiaceae bacterium]